MNTKEIRKRKPDIVFSGFGEVNAYLAMFIKFFPKTKFIARETNVVSQHVTRKEIRFFYKFYNNYHKIICQSDDMLNDLIENFKIKKEKIIKINNPVDFEFIDEKLENSAKPKSFADDFKNVVAVGNPCRVLREISDRDKEFYWRDHRFPDAGDA